MQTDLFDLIVNNDLDGLRAALLANSELANEGVTLKIDGKINPRKGHPLHRICDAVFANKITDNQAVGIAKIFLEYGADINGFMTHGDDNTPLIAAASLHAEQLGLFYIEKGANIFYAPPSDGGTALHWAAYCGRDKLVEKLIEKSANVNQLDTSYHSTPLGWAIHILESGETNNLHNQVACIKLLLKAGTNKSLLYQGSIEYLRNMAKTDPELKILLE
ncbi:MAG: ankyrin repeat domain-containing protein [Mucilaginibacter sp.]|nr:ankyrin repeat domain-containing protein [Mucilaginibacter sp.]